MSSIVNRIQELSNEMLRAKYTYYNIKLPDGLLPLVLTDKVYDAKEAELRSLDANHWLLKMVGAPVIQSEWKKAKHQIPMGSLNKVNVPEEMSKWVQEVVGDSDLFVTEKLDGLSIECIYENDKLVQCITRGDGQTGEDITSNVVKMQGVVPQLRGNQNITKMACMMIPQQDTFTGSIRGEIIMTKSIHQQYFADKANPRNAASGVSKRLDGIGSEHLTALFYQVLGDIDFASEVDQFRWLKIQGIGTPHYWLMDDAEAVNKHWRDYQDTKRDALDYDIDGLVVRISDLVAQQSLGDKDLRPLGAIAFKFDNEARESTLLDVVWEVGNSGRITPVAIVSPVVICGAEIKRASLHNVKRLEELGLYIGCKVLVSRRNDVIPYIEEKIV